MRAQRRYTPSRATTLPTGMDGATQIGSKHASQTKLLHGLTSSRVATIFAVPRQLDRTRSYSDQFSYLWVGRRPMRNSYLGLLQGCSLSGSFCDRFTQADLPVPIRKPQSRLLPV